MRLRKWVAARLRSLFYSPTPEEIKAARIRKNRSDGAKRGAATRARNKGKAKPEMDPGAQARAAIAEQL